VEEAVERSEAMVSGRGNLELDIDLDEVKSIITEGTPEELVAGKKVLILTPDATRTCPLPRMITAVKEVIGKRAERVDFMVALGSHHPLDDAQILKLYGISPERRAREFGDSSFFNHRWDLPGTLSKIGTIPEEAIEEITGGLFREAVDVDINRGIFDYDLLVILGPVFPHEVAGISGGNKYLFPGISGGDFLHFFHWLGAVISCWKIIGNKNTPVREVVNRAADMVPVPRHAICMVVGHGRERGRLAGLYAGSPQAAWSRAADLSQRMHIRYMNRPFHTVLGKAPEMYDELWVGGKVMYKLEPVVADGGKLIIYAPHLKEVSSTWGRYLEKTGYHVAEYFLKQWDRFRDVPRGVLAHSVHVKGLGSYENGVEKPRIEVILATGISEAMCRQLNLGYMDPGDVRIEEFQNREEEGVLFVDHAGEVLHRVREEKGN
jgi:nickel-dependent lactate racemase